MWDYFYRFRCTFARIHTCKRKLGCSENLLPYSSLQIALLLYSWPCTCSVSDHLIHSLTTEQTVYPHWLTLELANLTWFATKCIQIIRLKLNITLILLQTWSGICTSNLIDMYRKHMYGSASFYIFTQQSQRRMFSRLSGTQSSTHMHSKLIGQDGTCPRYSHTVQGVSSPEACLSTTSLPSFKQFFIRFPVRTSH